MQAATKSLGNRRTKMDMTLYEEIYAEKLLRLVQQEKPKPAGWAGRRARSQNKRPQTKPDKIGILILDGLS